MDAYYEGVLPTSLEKLLNVTQERRMTVWLSKNNWNPLLMFEYADANKDGQLSLPEVKAHLTSYWQPIVEQFYFDNKIRRGRDREAGGTRNPSGDRTRPPIYFTKTELSDLIFKKVMAGVNEAMRFEQLFPWLKSMSDQLGLPHHDNLEQNAQKLMQFIAGRSVLANMFIFTMRVTGDDFRQFDGTTLFNSSLFYEKLEASLPFCDRRHTIKCSDEPYYLDLNPYDREKNKEGMGREQCSSLNNHKFNFYCGTLDLSSASQEIKIQLANHNEACTYRLNIDGNHPKQKYHLTVEGANVSAYLHINEKNTMLRIRHFPGTMEIVKATSLNGNFGQDRNLTIYANQLPASFKLTYSNLSAVKDEVGTSGNNTVDAPVSPPKFDPNVTKEENPVVIKPEKLPPSVPDPVNPIQTNTGQRPFGRPNSGNRGDGQ